MGRVVASIRIYPSEAGIDLNRLKADIEASLPSHASVYNFEEEPIAFGLVALIAHVLMPEAEEGAMEKVEEALKTLKDVSEIQVISVGRVA